LNRFSTLCFVLEIREGQSAEGASPILAKNSIGNNPKRRNKTI